MKAILVLPDSHRHSITTHIIHSNPVHIPSIAIPMIIILSIRQYMFPILSLQKKAGCFLMAMTSIFRFPYMDPVTLLSGLKITGSGGTSSLEPDGSVVLKNGSITVTAKVVPVENLPDGVVR